MTKLSLSAPFVSAAALALALGQSVLTSSACAAEPPPPAMPPAAPTQTAQGTPSAATPTVSPAESARARAEERRAAMDEARAQRYRELRTRAAEIGVDLPETPPWESARAKMPPMPEVPAMPGAQPSQSGDYETMRQQYRAAREAHWQKMRAEAEQRRQDMAARFQQYRETVEGMTDEQREAARAMFGRPQSGFQDRMPPDGNARGTWDAPCHDDLSGMPYPPMMPNYPSAPGYDQGQPLPQTRSGR